MSDTRTSSEWETALGVRVLDPDGWDRTNLEESWAEFITESEFRKRAAVSTICIVKGVDVTNVTEPDQPRKGIALDYLVRAVRNPWSTPQMLAERTRLAVEYGCSAAEIRAAWGDA